MFVCTDVSIAAVLYCSRAPNQACPMSPLAIRLQAYGWSSGTRVVKQRGGVKVIKRRRGNRLLVLRRRSACITRRLFSICVGLRVEALEFCGLRFMV